MVNATRRCADAAALIAPLSLFALALHAAPGCAAPAHEHGMAHLDVVIDGKELVISLDSPLANLVGFEHAPRTDAQRDALRKMEAALQAPNLFKPDPAAGCKLNGVSIEHPYRNGAAPKAAASSEHADADISWRFTCGSPAALRQLEVGLFDRFSGLHALPTQLAGPRGQTAAALTRQQRVLSW